MNWYPYTTYPIGYNYPIEYNYPITTYNYPINPYVNVVEERIRYYKQVIEYCNAEIEKLKPSEFNVVDSLDNLLTYYKNQDADEKRVRAIEKAREIIKKPDSEFVVIEDDSDDEDEEKREFYAQKNDLTFDDDILREL